ncbi:hypothetical protein AAG565_10090 [Fontimonas sp. SYSU GA230001]|uniref:hypothetical protein n=1 Tax=Fontimonas sp. SYSU GA230001 TaxID=3142450 RepID=UPI0032B62854
MTDSTRTIDKSKAFRIALLMSSALAGACSEGRDSQSIALACDSFATESFSYRAVEVPAGCCSMANPDAIFDGDLGSLAEVTVSAGAHHTTTLDGASSTPGSTYDAGSKPGFLIARPATVTTAMLTVQTTLRGEVVETVNGDALNIASPGDQVEYIFLDSQFPFDGVRVTVDVENQSDNVRYKVFELCSHAEMD